MSPVRFEVPASVAFDYLADPANRAEWQSSLARVTDVSGPVGVGQSWIDVTVPRLRPAMRTTAYDRPRVWTEEGTWRAFEATLTLTFTDIRTSPAPEEPAGACEVAVEMELRGRGLVRPLAALLDLVSPRAVRSDLTRAARLLGPTTASA